MYILSHGKSRQMLNRLQLLSGVQQQTCLLFNTVEPRVNEPLYNEVVGITNDFSGPSNSKVYGKEPAYILPVPWPFVKSRFHCAKVKLKHMKKFFSLIESSAW